MNLHDNRPRAFQIGYFTASLHAPRRNSNRTHVYQGPINLDGRAIAAVPYLASMAICGYLFQGDRPEDTTLLAAARPPSCRDCFALTRDYQVPGYNAPPHNYTATTQTPRYNDPPEIRARYNETVREMNAFRHQRHVLVNGRRPRWRAPVFPPR